MSEMSIPRIYARNSLDRDSNIVRGFQTEKKDLRLSASLFRDSSSEERDRR